MFKKVALSVGLCLCFFIGGCWDANDIENMSIPIAAAYDISRSGEDTALLRYQITTINPNLIAEAPKKYRIESIAGQTIGEIRNKRHFESPRPYVVGMLQVGIFSEEVAETGIGKITDIIYRAPEISNTLLLAVAEGRADKVMNTRSENYPEIGYFLNDLLRNAQKNSFMITTTLHEMAQGIYTPGKNPVMPALKTDGKNVTHAGTAIFEKDRLIDIIDQYETRTLVLLRGISTAGYIKYALEREGSVMDEGTVFAANRRKVEVQREGEKFIFVIKINLEGPLVERFNDESLMTNPKLLTVIEDQIASDIRRECDVFIAKMQNDYRIDCIDISKYALARWRKELTPVIDKGFIENADIKVEVRVKITNVGDID